MMHLPCAASTAANRMTDMNPGSQSERTKVPFVEPYRVTCKSLIVLGHECSQSMIRFSHIRTDLTFPELLWRDGGSVEIGHM